MTKIKIWILNKVWNIWSKQFRFHHEKMIRAGRKRKEIEDMIRQLKYELREKNK